MYSTVRQAYVLYCTYLRNKQIASVAYYLLPSTQTYAVDRPGGATSITHRLHHATHIMVRFIAYPKNKKNKKPHIMVLI